MTKTNRIKELRTKQKLSQRQLGNAIGTAQQTISRLEKGNYSPPVDLVINLSEFFDVSIDYLLGFTDVKERFENVAYLNSKLEEHHELIKKYDKLGDVNKRTLQIVLERLIDTELKIKG